MISHDKKRNSPPYLACRQFAHCHETVLWAARDRNTKHTFNYKLMKNGDWHQNDEFKNDGKQMRSVWSINTPKKSEKAHGKYPTMKPQELLDRIVLSSTNEGDVIFDPFMGRGSLGVAAVRHGRKYVGVDSNTEAFQLALKRIDEQIAIKVNTLINSQISMNSQNSIKESM